MKKTIVQMLAAAFVGGLLAWLLFGRADTAPRLSVEPTLSSEAVEEQREKYFVDLTTLEDVLTLPTPFARREAAYALAGRSGPTEINEHISVAVRIADPDERIAILGILVARLTEMSPRGALELASSGELGDGSRFEELVWMEWAKIDLEAAIFEARLQPSSVRQQHAAQALFRAHGNYDNDIVDYIAAELGIEPDDSNRYALIRRLAEESVESAIAYVNAMPPGSKRRAMANSLGSYLARNDPYAAEQYVEQFNDGAIRSVVQRIVSSRLAALNPRAVVDQLLASGREGIDRYELSAALRSFAEQDIESAMAYFSELAGMEERNMLAQHIATELAARDVDAALEWARANERGTFPVAEMMALNAIASLDPERAIAEAMANPNSQHRRMLISNVMGRAALADPQLALTLVDQIPPGRQRTDAIGSVLMSVGQRDPDAAIDWLLRIGAEDAGDYIMQFGAGLAASNPQAIARLMPALDEQQQVRLAQQVVRQMAVTRSADDTLAYVEQFAGRPGYDSLRATVISSISESDPDRALQLVGSLPEGRERDQVLSSIIGNVASRSPNQAMLLLDSISNDNQRHNATMQLAMYWYHNDPGGALQWVRDMAPGKTRDESVLRIAHSWDGSSMEIRSLLDTIQSSHTRGQAKATIIMRMLRTDRAAALDMLEDPDIPAESRAQINQMIDSSRF